MGDLTRCARRVGGGRRRKGSGVQGFRGSGTETATATEKAAAGAESAETEEGSLGLENSAYRGRRAMRRDGQGQGGCCGGVGGAPLRKATKLSQRGVAVNAGFYLERVGHYDEILGWQDTREWMYTIETAANCW